MWSDMYITSNTGSSYYDIDQNTDTSGWEKPDPDLGLVYWDYYNADEQLAMDMLRVHKELSSKVIFAGGIWNWNGISPNYGKAIRCTKTALTACRKQKITDVFATGWMDNGAETPIDAMYPGLVVFAQLCFHEKLEQKELEQIFEDCIGGRYQDFYALDAFDSFYRNGRESVCRQSLQVSAVSGFPAWNLRLPHPGVGYPYILFPSCR